MGCGGSKPEPTPAEQPAAEPNAGKGWGTARSAAQAAKATAALGDAKGKKQQKRKLGWGAAKATAAVGSKPHSHLEETSQRKKRSRQSTLVRSQGSVKRLNKQRWGKLGRAQKFLIPKKNDPDTEAQAARDRAIAAEGGGICVEIRGMTLAGHAAETWMELVEDDKVVWVEVRVGDLPGGGRRSKTLNCAEAEEEGLIDFGLSQLLKIDPDSTEPGGLTEQARRAMKAKNPHDSEVHFVLLSADYELDEEMSVAAGGDAVKGSMISASGQPILDEHAQGEEKLASSKLCLKHLHKTGEDMHESAVPLLDGSGERFGSLSVTLVAHETVSKLLAGGKRVPTVFKKDESNGQTGEPEPQKAETGAPAKLSDGSGAGEQDNVRV